MERITIAPDGTARLEISDPKGEIWEYALAKVGNGLGVWACEVTKIETGDCYRVAEETPGRWQCSCPAWKYCRTRPHTCKHCRTVANLSPRQRQLLESLTAQEVAS
jgi:hypothetical protein